MLADAVDDALVLAAAGGAGFAIRRDTGDLVATLGHVSGAITSHPSNEPSAHLGRLPTASRTVVSVRICGKTSARGGVRPIIQIKWHAVAALLPKKFGDRRVLPGPVALQIRHMLRGERALHRVVTDRHPLVHQAGDAPGGRQVDEHRPSLGPQRRESRRRERFAVARLAAGRRRPARVPIPSQRRQRQRRRRVRRPAQPIRRRSDAQILRDARGSSRQSPAERSRSRCASTPAAPAS